MPGGAQSAPEGAIPFSFFFFEGKKVLSPDFDKWLDKQIKDDKKKPKVDKLRLCPYDKNLPSSSSTISSSTSSASEEEEDTVEEIKK